MNNRAMGRRRKNDNYYLLALLGVMVLFAPQAGNAQGTAIAGTSAFAGIALGVFFLVYAYRHAQEFTRREKLRALHLADVDTMSGLEFEKFVGELYRAQGYHIEFTPVVDYGVDIVASKDGIRTAIQTKRYKKSVKQAVVREVVAGMWHYKCSKCIVVTNNYFTKAAAELAYSNHCKLVDREGLADLIASARSKSTRAV